MFRCTYTWRSGKISVVRLTSMYVLTVFFFIFIILQLRIRRDHSCSSPSVLSYKHSHVEIDFEKKIT